MGGDVIADADRCEWVPNSRALAELTGFLTTYCPDFLGPVLYTKPCFYTMPPDREFIIDTLPDHPNIAVAVGAGHAAKFSCLIGQILSQLLLDGKTPYPVQPFRVRRPALTEPNYPTDFRR